MDAEKLVTSMFLIILFVPSCISLDTLTSDQSIKDGQSLISKENYFVLGFFSPSNSSYRYRGIWYVKVTKQTVVWVANRNDSINDSIGVLSINQSGNLVLRDCHNRLLWSTNVCPRDNLLWCSASRFRKPGIGPGQQQNVVMAKLWLFYRYFASRNEDWVEQDKWDQ